MDATEAVHDPRCFVDDAVSMNLKEVKISGLGIVLDEPAAPTHSGAVPTTRLELSYASAHEPSGVFSTTYSRLTHR